MRYVSMFFRRITSDFRQKELLPLKLLFFVHASTLYVLYPYLTIHMRELGINVEEAAIMSAVTPIVAIIMPPLAGMVADRIGNFKFILAVFNGLGGATSLLLLLVPVGRITFTYPDRTILALSCPSNNAEGLLSMTLAESHTCNTLPSIGDTQFKNESLLINAQLEACGLICTRHPTEFLPQSTPSNPDSGLYDFLEMSHLGFSQQKSTGMKETRGPKTIEAESTAILSTRNYTVIIQNAERNTTDQYTYTLKADDLPLFKSPRPEDEDKRNLRQMVNKAHFPTSVRMLTTTKYFFPTSGLFNLSCEPDDEKNITNLYLCNIEKSNGIFPSVVASKAEVLDMKIKSAPSKNPANVKKFYVTDLNILQNGAGKAFMDTTCSVEEEVLTETVLVPLPNPENNLETDSLLNLKDCKKSCIVTVPRNKLCTNMENTVEYDIRLTFWIYLIIRVFIGMISGTAFAMFEGAVIAILRNHKGDYGLQRIYAAIGGMISSPLSGVLIDYASTGKGYTDFRPAFYLYAGLKIVSGVLMLSMNLQFKSPATNVVKDVMTVLRNIEIVALFITCFILGTAWGYIESFLFWLLQDLGASRSLMGITITIGGIAGLPLLVMSGPIIDRIGHANVLFIGFIFYAIRLMGYSLIYNPWMCLIFEAMESVTSSLAITAAVTYAAKLSTNTTDSSIQGLLGGLYFGVGKGAGSLVGGYLMKAVGTRPTYQIFSAVTLVTGCLYYVFNHFYIVRRTHLRNKHDPDKKALNFGAWEVKSPAVLDKEREAKRANSNHNNIKEGNHIVENVPLKVSVPSIKSYTNDVSSKGAENHSTVNTDTGGSEKVNLGFEKDEEDAHLRSRSYNQADDSRNKEER